MANTPVYANNSVPPERRRTRMRYPVSALAYLDIGDDNGGIVLNLSEEGLGLQAVAPLRGLKEIRLRIQLPHLEARIETAAQIVWLGEANRQAGVRFLNLPAVVRNQIREWIKSQASSGAPAGDAADVVTPERAEKGSADTPHVGTGSQKPAVPARTAMSADDPRTGKWLSLMAEFEADLGTQGSAKINAGLASTPQAVLPPAVPTPSRPEIVFRRFGDRAQPASTDSQREATKIAEKTPAQATLAASASELQLASPQEASFQPLPITPTFEPTYGLSRVAGSGVVSATRPTESGPVAASASRARRVRNQTVAVAAFALFSILCFGIGTRVGHWRSRQLPSASGALETSAEASALTHAKGQKDGVSEARGLRRFAKSSARVKTYAPVSRGAVGFKTDLARPTSPMQRMNGPGTISPAASSQGAALVPSAETTTDFSNPRVVDGYVLKPSDRFNPCHLTYRVEPVYPPEAQQQRIEGTVKIHVMIAADGSVQSERLISGPPALASAAMDAAKYWRYFPALLNGEPVPVEKDIDVVFRLPH